MAARIVMTTLPGMPRVRAGDDLAALIVAAAANCGETLEDGDILVVAQKIVSKAEDRMVDLSTVDASDAARDLAEQCDKDPRQMELVLARRSEVMRARRGVVIVALRNGMVLANAGIDRSNVDGTGEDHVLLLPADADAVGGGVARTARGDQRRASWGHHRRQHRPRLAAGHDRNGDRRGGGSLPHRSARRAGHERPGVADHGRRHGRRTGGGGVAVDGAGGGGHARGVDPGRRFGAGRRAGRRPGAARRHGPFR